MADTNREAEEFTRIMAQVNYEMRAYGELSASTAARRNDAEMKAKFGLDDFSKSTGMGADALAKFGAAAFSSGKALLAAKNGTADFGGAIDQMTDAVKMAAVALTLLVPGGPLIKGLMAGIGLLTVSVLEAGKEYMKATNAMREQLAKGYQDLALSGAAASDGMTGLFKDAKKLGLSMNDIGQYTELIAANSKDLALFSGTVFEGRQKFADMGQAMEPFKESLLNAGLTQEQINAGAMGYLKLQTRIGMSQTQTSAQLADGAKKYLIEMDGLSKITGETRKSMEDQMEAARSEERFAAKLQELRSQGRHDEAKQLELANLMISKENKALAQGFRDASTGMITTEAAQKAMLVTQGQVMVQADRMSNGLANAAEGATIIGQTAGNTAKSMTGLAKAGAYIGADFSADLRSGMTDFSKAQIAAEKELEAQGGKGSKALDPLVQKQTELTLKIQEGNKAVENFVFAGVGPSTDALILLTHNTTLAAGAMAKMFGLAGQEQGGTGPELGSGGTIDGAVPDTAAIAASGGVLGQLAAEDKMKKLPEYEKTLAEIERYQKLFNDGNKLNEKQLEGFKKRSEIAAQAVADYNKKFAAPAGGGAGGGAAPAAGGGAAPAAPAAAPAAPAARSVKAGAAPASLPSGGPSQEPKRSWEEYIKFTGGTGTKEHFAKLLSPVQQNFAQMAEDYMTLTGKRLQVNSAFRSPEEQAKVNSGSNPKALPGHSKHQQGRAIDINSSQVEDLKRSGLLQEFGFSPLQNDPPHIFMKDGGIVKASEGGTPAVIGEGGQDEAVIPLKNGAVPVSVKLDLNNVMAEGGIGPTFGGYNQYTGINQGHVSTDLSAVKDIAAGMGAFDKATQTITNPDVWKEIINSGIAMNFELGVAQLGTAVIPGIGEEIAARIKEIQEQHNTDGSKALEQAGVEFRAAMAEALAEMLRTKGETSMPGMDHVAEGIREMARTNASQLEVMQKILATNY
jgi:hypothetical protein